MNGIKYAKWAKHYDPKQEELNILQRHGIDFKNKKVLEVGCGTGRFTERILPLCDEIVCIDPDNVALSVLKSNLNDNRMTILNGTLENIPVKKEYFDYVVFSWSMYLIDEKEKNLKLAYDLLKPTGKLIVLQANSGEYENEIAHLYSKYDSLDAYSITCDELPDLLKKFFCDVICDTLYTYFSFNTIDEVIENSLFFIEDEEGSLPDENAIQALRNRLCSYITDDGKIIMSDIVSVFIAKKLNIN